MKGGKKKLSGTGEEAAGMKGEQGLSAFEDAAPNATQGTGAGDSGSGPKVVTGGNRTSPRGGSD